MAAIVTLPYPPQGRGVGEGVIRTRALIIAFQYFASISSILCSVRS